MFAHDGRASAQDLSYWLGPLSPTFAAMNGGPLSSPTPSGSYGGAPSPSPLPGHGSVPGAAAAPPTAAAADMALEGPVNQPDLAELRTLFHTLNNQLGVILTYAELLEAKAPDEGLRARATQIVTAAMDALGTSKQIRTTVVK